MALAQLMIDKKIKQRQAQIEELESVDFDTRSAELETSIDEAKTDEELETVEESIRSLEQERQENNDQKETLQGEIEELEKELREIQDKKPEKKKESRRMENNNMEVREGIKNYVQSKGQARDGFTSVEGGALIPEELLQPQVVPEDETDLSKLVNVAKVSSAGGKYPVIKKSDGKMNSVEELEKNPELAKPTITEVPFDIETYRGYIPVSQEVIDDADYDVVGLIANEISNQDLNTRNKAIAEVLKESEAKTVANIDDLKEVFNVDIKKVYNAKAIISASMYNALDTIKDDNGRYLLQDDITASSGKKLLGKEVVVLDDEVIGEEAGDQVGFIGDPKAAVTFFDRKRASVKWIDNDVYGQLLAGFVRFDVQPTDTNAGFYVTFGENSDGGDDDGESGN